MGNRKRVMREFVGMRNMAELRALSNYSLEHPLNDSQFKRMMELKGDLIPKVRGNKYLRHSVKYITKGVKK